MSLHRGYVAVQEIETLGTQATSNVHNADNIELLEYPSYNNFLQSSPAVTTANMKKSTSEQKFYAKFWARVTKSFVECRALFLDWWMGELLAILLSIIAFSAIIIILVKFDNHALPTLPQNVPLNFVVSTLATISKNLQIFDEASKNPLGAVKLLASKKNLSWASIGAVVTLFCLIFDPFIQGLISIRERMVYKNDPAAYVHSLGNYTDLNEIPNDGDFADSFVGLLQNFPFINTINDAAFNPNPQSETQPNCPTGNCTWPLFTSLGICSKCQDFSQPLRNSSTYVDFDYITPCPSEADETTQCNNSARNYTYRFPELNNQSFSLSFDLLGPEPEFFVFPLDWPSDTNVTTPTFNFTDGISVQPFALISFVRKFMELPDSGNVLAADLCALSFCTQKRNVSVSFNRLSSTILQTEYGTISEHHNNDSDGEPILWLSFRGDNFNFTYPSQGNGTNYYDYYDRLIANWTFSLSIITANLVSIIDSFKGKLFGVGHLGRNIQTSATSNIINAFNSSSNISMTMDNIATAMTNYFRDFSNITVIGQTGRTEFYVHVIWPWIILPVFLVITGTIFLILAMFETKKLEARVWKTSELALLFHGLEESGQELGTLFESSEMEDMASKTRVKIAKTSGGRWILRRKID